MLINRRSYALLLFFSLGVSGCFNLDFGSGSDSEIKGCGFSSAQTVAMYLEDRYALGARTSLSVSGLASPVVNSSNTAIVRVGPILDDKVTLSFLAEGEATITVRDRSEAASAAVAVAPLERFEVVLPAAPSIFAPPDPIHQLPLDGKALIDPGFEVFYFDNVGRLFGGGLAETTWMPTEGGSADAFSNVELESGPHQVEVRVGDLDSVISFEAVARDEVESLVILETDLGQGRFRVDAVGLTASGTEVWNIAPYFDLGDDAYIGSFEYTFDPDAPLTTVTARSLSLPTNDSFAPAETTIRRARSQVEPVRRAAITPSKGRAPLMAILSLLMMTLAIRATVSIRPALRAEADTPF